MKKIFYPLYMALFLAACVTTENGYQTYLQKKKVAVPAGLSLQHCHGYGCRLVSDITLSEAEWRDIAKIFVPQPENADEERGRIVRAIGLFERIVGPKDATDKDIRGTFRKVGDGQLDCVDESTNTTVYLSLLQSNGLIRFHRLAPPTMRVPLIHAGRWPHQTAVITDTKSGVPYAVDSWFHDGGADAEIIDLKTWKSGWKPESVRDFL